MLRHFLLSHFLLRHAFAGVLSLACLCGLTAHVAAHAADQVAIPALSAHVMDTADMLQPEQRESLEAALTLYEQGKGTQLVVLTVPTTAPEGIEQYGIRVAETWKVGRKDIADGVIIIVAKDNPSELRRLRIEVGRGLEGALPDATAKRIIDESIAPQFRQENYYGGLMAGVNRIKNVLDGEALPTVQTRVPTLQNNAQVSKWFPFVLLGVFFFVLVLMRLGGRRVAHLSGNRSVVRSQYSNHDVLLPVILGSILNSRGSGGGGSFGGSFGEGGGFSGGGGDFSGGGASGDW